MKLDELKLKHLKDKIKGKSDSNKNDTMFEKHLMFLRPT